MIPTVALLISLLSSLAVAQTAMLDDLNNLTTACLSVAEILNASLNDTTAMVSNRPAKRSGSVFDADYSICDAEHVRPHTNSRL
jgi:hypothetical protein